MLVETQLFELSIGREDRSNANVRIARGFVRRWLLFKDVDRDGFEFMRREVLDVGVRNRRRRR